MSVSVLESRANVRGAVPLGETLKRLLQPLDKLAAHSDYLVRKPFGAFESEGRIYSLPRYLFLGPQGGGEIIRIGVFASIHGDEEQAALAVTEFAHVLQDHPDLARGYALFFYPVCNPTGVEDKTRHSRSGKDLNREFWRDSSEPEVQLLETEIWSHAFHGIINLHSDDTSHGLYGFVNGAVLSEYLLEPALKAAEEFLPRNGGPRIDGFEARKGIIYDCYSGVLQAPAGLKPSPFEITLETPHCAPVALQVKAFTAALRSVLSEYRGFIALGQNI